MEKRGVSIKKVLIDCFRYWYLLVLFGILGCFVGWRSCIRYNQHVVEVEKEAAAQKAKEKEEALELAKDEVEEIVFTKEQCEKELSKSEMRSVMDAYDLYLARQKRRNYINSSAYLQLDPIGFTSTYLEFRVDQSGEDRNENSFNSYVHSMKNYVTYNGLVDDLSGGDTEMARKLAELVSVNDGGKDTYDSVLVITVMEAPETEGMIDKVEKQFVAQGDALAATYPGYSVKLSSKYKATYYNNSLSSAQDTQRSGLSSDQSKIDSALKKLNSMQNAYYKMLVNGTEEETIEVVLLKGATTKKKSTTTIEVPSKRSTKTMILLGGVAGLLVAVLAFFFGNLLSGRLLFRKDLSEICGIRFSGIVRERKKSGIPGMLQKLEYPDVEDAENPAFLYLQLREILKASGKKEAVLLGSGELSHLTCVEKLVTMGKEDDIIFSSESHFPEDLSAAEHILQTRAVVLVEQMHKAKMISIEKTVHFCRENDIAVLGAIGVDGVKKA